MDTYGIEKAACVVYGVAEVLRDVEAEHADDRLAACIAALAWCLEALENAAGVVR